MILAFMDIDPETPGHVLIVPKQHLPGLTDLDDDVATEMFACAAGGRRSAALDPTMPRDQPVLHRRRHCWAGSPACSPTRLPAVSGRRLQNDRELGQLSPPGRVGRLRP